METGRSVWRCWSVSGWIVRLDVMRENGKMKV
jgi:hypothetical protein